MQTGKKKKRREGKWAWGHQDGAQKGSHKHLGYPVSLVTMSRFFISKKKHPFPIPAVIFLYLGLDFVLSYDGVNLE